MRERPILFSGPMIRAILDGSKSQTRRVLKPQPTKETTRINHAGTDISTGKSHWCCLGDTYGAGVPCRDGKSLYTEILCPYGTPGDRLWVRETFGLGVQNGSHAWVNYRAGGTMDADDSIDQVRTWQDRRDVQWYSSIHMPRWASRLTLTITDVRVERLQDISPVDAQAEGLVPWSKDGKLTKYGVADPDGMPGSDYEGTWPWHEWRISPVDAYQKLWESINGAGSWDANPWVWVVSFARVSS